MTDHSSSAAAASDSPTAAPQGRVMRIEGADPIVIARPRSTVAAWVIDALVVLVVGGAAVLGSWRVFGAGDSAAFALTVAVGGVGAAALAFGYGAILPGGSSAGRRVAGIRLARLADGSAPGPLRAGWVMLTHTLLAPVGLVVDAAGMGAGDGPMWHVLIDDRETRALRAGIVGATS